MEIINLLDRKSKFTDVLKYYRNELIKILMNTKTYKSIESSKPDNIETFTNNDIVEDFISLPGNSEYIYEDFKSELMNKYKEKDFYHIESYKHNSHKKRANLYKNMTIITPMMDDNAIGSVNL